MFSQFSSLTGCLHRGFAALVPPRTISIHKTRNFQATHQYQDTNGTISASSSLAVETKTLTLPRVGDSPGIKNRFYPFFTGVPVIIRQERHCETLIGHTGESPTPERAPHRMRLSLSRSFAALTAKPSATHAVGLAPSATLAHIPKGTMPVRQSSISHPPSSPIILQLRDKRTILEKKVKL